MNISVAQTAISASISAQNQISVNLVQSSISVVVSSGVIERASRHLNFDGNADYINIPSSSSVTNLPANNLTIELVLKRLPGVLSRADGVVASKAHPVNQAGWYFSIYDGGAGWRWIVFELYNSVPANYGYFDYPIDFNLPQAFDGEPHHWAVCYNSTNKTCKFYIDGVEITPSFSETVGGFGTTGYNINDSSHTMRIGNQDFASSPSPLTGEINWLMISSGLKYSGNFTTPSLTVCPSADENTVLRYALDEGSGATAFDTSGNGNNGTIVGATWELDT